jgi:hypothetical protein
MDISRPRAHCRARWILLAALWLLAGCGGSGSSGFDLALLENRAIDRAVMTEMCQDVDGLTICPAAGTPEPTPTQTARPTHTASPTRTVTPGSIATPSATHAVPEATPSATVTATAERPRDHTPTATPTPTDIPGTPNVSTNLGDGNALPCGIDQEPCELDFRFMPENIDPNATFWIAARPGGEPPGVWRIFPDPNRSGAQDAPAFEQPIAVDLPEPDSTYQIAVLVFFVPPADAPETVERLGETGADLAFVTAVLHAQP